MDLSLPNVLSVLNSTADVVGEDLGFDQYMFSRQFGCQSQSVDRITGIHRDTIMRLGARVGRGCAELHDRMMVGIRAGRLELDEIWGFVGKKQKRVERHEISAWHRPQRRSFLIRTAP